MSSEASHVIAYTSFADRAEALSLARSAVQSQLAASAQVYEVTSIRPLQGQVGEAAEYILSMKTAAPMIEALKAHVLKHHSGEVPEFVVLPIVAANEKYLALIDDYVDERRTLEAEDGPRGQELLRQAAPLDPGALGQN